MRANLDVEGSPQLTSNEIRLDVCLHCQAPLEIVVLKFGFRGTRMVASCSNCAMAFAEDCSDPRSSKASQAEQSAASREPGWSGMAEKLEQLRLRTTYVIGLLLAAVITAAALRHTIHMYGGIPPDQIRTAALLGVPATIFSIILFRRKRG
jgi:hypothetical protein